jgi:hypothetical protein
MLDKEHNTIEGIQKIVQVRSYINLGLSNDLKKAFPIIIPSLAQVKLASCKNNIVCKDLDP